MRRTRSLVVLVGALMFVPPPAGSDPGGLIVHECGTFTSVAGEDGRAVEWLPQAGRSDLPSFVERTYDGPKALLPGTIRMETPVIYFYAARETVVDVGVRFRNGVITEWFPRGRVTPREPINGRSLRRAGFAGGIAWQGVHVEPRGWTALPTEAGRSHYYAARETDASPVAVGAQREKFLFYRGVAAFDPAIAATITPDGSIAVTSLHDEPLGQIILFENRDGRMAYEVRHGAGTATTFAPGLPEGQAEPLFAELESILVADGLYPREAKAMVATWRDSWFEEGSRVFYVVSRRAVDAILPLEIDPQPSEVARVFVGRVELITGETLSEVRDALARKDEPTLRKYGRFLQPILNRLNSAYPHWGPRWRES
jgi:hypothetical protein